MCHVGRRAVLCAAGIFCFPLSIPFSGVPIEESCRERKGDGTVAFPHVMWNLTFLLLNVLKLSLSFLFISCAALPWTFSVVHWCLDYHVGRIPTHLPRHQLSQKMTDKGHQRPYFCCLAELSGGFLRAWSSHIWFWCDFGGLVHDIVPFLTQKYSNGLIYSWRGDKKLSKNCSK